MRTLLAVVLTALLVGVFALGWQQGWIERLSDPDELAVAMRQSGWRGPAICIGIQFVQVVIFVIPGEVTQVAAGYVFGPWLGFLYSAAGIALGAALNFTFSRLVGRPVVTKLLGDERMRRIDEILLSAKGRSALFAVFLIPGLPKDALSYGAGLTSYGTGEFLVISMLARSPAMLFSTLLGDQLSERDWVALSVTLIVGAIATGLFLLYQHRLRRSA